jgi:protein TonB
MAKRLVSNEPNPKDIRFSHFGVLDDGKRSKSAAVTSIGINVAIILLLVVVGAIVKTNPQLAAKISPIYVPPPKPKPPAPKPPPPPPKPLPEIPKLKVEPPKIVNLPKPIEPPPELKPLPAPVPKPVQLNTPAPKLVAAPPAPKAVNLSAPAKAASIANNDAHPSAVRLGNPEIKALNGPAVASPVNLGGGMHGMPASNTGSGPVGKVSLGNGSPTGSNLNARAVVPVAGLSHGTPGGTGTGVSGPKSVGLGVAQTAAPPPVAAVHAAPMAKPPVVTAQPKAQFTADAKTNHIQGDIRISVVFHANGTISVGNVVGAGLGHGLNEEAMKVAAGTRFKPAMDANGQPVDFPTVMTVHFLAND